MSATAETAVPDGCLEDHAGRFVPRANVREADLLRDDVATRLAQRAVNLNDQIAQYKRDALSELEDLVEIAADKHDVRLGGQKGNLSIATYNGRYKIERAYADRLTFTEEIKVAKKLIDTCIERWSEGASDKIKLLVERAFRTDKQGDMRTHSVLELLQYEIEDDEWTQAMDALRDSIRVTGTAVYVRIYRRDDNGRYQPVPLNIAAV